jgi:hypothetical protein
MNEEQWKAMALTSPTQASPVDLSQSTVAMAESIQSDEVEIATSSLAQAYQYMEANGPVRPVQNQRRKVMTKAQLEEQKMNEGDGYPSNIGDATRVRSLEAQVANINSNIEKLANIMGQAVQGNRGQRPTPPVQRDPLYPEQQRQGQTSRSVSRGMGPTDPLMGPPTPPPEEPPFPGHTVQTFTTGDGNVTYPPPPVSIGPVGSAPSTPPDDVVAQPGSPTDIMTQQVAELMKNQVVDETSGYLAPVDGVDDPSGQIREIVDKEAVINQESIEKHQILTEQVQEWLKTKDPYKFFRRFLAGTCNKNLSLDTWPHPLVAAFTTRFYPMLQDHVFVSTICQRIKTFQNGHLVAPHVAGAFVTICAGILAFSLAEPTE